MRLWWCGQGSVGGGRGGSHHDARVVEGVEGWGGAG